MYVADQVTFLSSYFDTIVLGLIVFHAVVLVIQAAPAISEPRDQDGYFRGWEDVALLVIFFLYTVEAFARMAVTGLIFDADITLKHHTGDAEPRKVSHSRVVWGRYQYASHRLRHALFPEQETVPLSPSAHITQDHLRSQQKWRSEHSQQHRLGGRPHSRKEKQTHLSKSEPGRKPLLRNALKELPFQAAMERQMRLVTTGRPYLRHSWHRIDLLAIICFWIMFGLALSGFETDENRHIFIFRALSVLRTARLLLLTSGTATILQSLKRSGPLMARVGFFLGFAALLFGIIGVQSFSGSFRRACFMQDPHNVTNIISLEKSCGGYVDPVTLDHIGWLKPDGDHSYKPKGYVCPLGQVCRSTDDNEINLGTFDNIFQSLLQVTIIASSNSYNDIMYQLMDSENFASGIFVVVALVVLNLWLVSMIVAVVVGTFQAIRAEGRSGFGIDEYVLDMILIWHISQLLT